VLNPGSGRAVLPLLALAPELLAGCDEVLAAWDAALLAWDAGSRCSVATLPPHATVRSARSVAECRMRRP
jgi:hypothetical protein